MQFTFLGTQGMIPTKRRNVSGYFLRYKEQGILFDCGEGTQRQMNLTGLKRTSITKICISHWHGDHISGLCGLLHTINNETQDHIVELYGPKGTRQRMEALLYAIDLKHPTWLHIHELDPEGVEVVCDTPEFRLLVAPLVHATSCVGYAFVEKERIRVDKQKLADLGITEGPHVRELKEGKDIMHNGKRIKADEVTFRVPGRKLTFITDTTICDACWELAEDADVLVCESTYAHDLVEKAREYKHLTAVEAAQIASQANVKKLYLTHFSQRYKDVQPLEQEARMVFDQTFAAEDFLKVTI